jgi:HSP20 family protein
LQALEKQNPHAYIELIEPKRSTYPTEFKMTALSIYDPFADVFPSLFRGFFDDSARRTVAREVARPAIASFAIDVSEDVKAYTVIANLPGMSKEHIHVEIDGNQVRIRAERGGESTEKNDETSKVLRTERFNGSYARGFSLPQELDNDGASAKYEQGVLTLNLPKKAQVSAKRLAIA